MVRIASPKSASRIRLSISSVNLLIVLYICTFGKYLVIKALNEDDSTGIFVVNSSSNFEP